MRRSAHVVEQPQLFAGFDLADRWRISIRFAGLRDCDGPRFAHRNRKGAEPELFTRSPALSAVIYRRA